MLFSLCRRQVELVNQLLFESAHSGNSDALFSVLENGDDVNPIVRHTHTHTHTHTRHTQTHTRTCTCMHAHTHMHIALISVRNLAKSASTFLFYYLQNETHDWPLILAAGYGHLDLVQQLHEFGGHVTQKNKLNQLTPLHVAARGGHKEVVR